VDWLAPVILLVCFFQNRKVKEHQQSAEYSSNIKGALLLSHSDNAHQIYLSIQSLKIIKNLMSAGIVPKYSNVTLTKPLEFEIHTDYQNNDYALI